MGTLFSFILLAISWAFAVYSYGGVQPESWRWSVLGFAMAAVVAWLFPGRQQVRDSRKFDLVVVGLVLLIGVGQLVRLPAEGIRLLSPHRFEQLATLSQVSGPITGAPLSSVPDASREWGLSLAAYALVYLLACELQRRLRDRQWAMVFPIVAVAAVEAVLGIIQVYTGGGVATGTYVNRNHLAGLLEMSLPFALMYGIFTLSRNQHRFETPAKPTAIACVFFGAGAAMLISVIHSQSRMGFLCILASLSLVGVIAVCSHYSPAGGPWRRWLPMAAVIACVAVAFVFLPTDQLIDRFASMATTQEPAEGVRRELWKETLPLIADYPVTGCGLGAYESCFLPYKKVAPGYRADFAHNDYLQVMAEIGLPGSFLLVALALLAYGNALRSTARDHPRRYLAIACVGSLSAILLHSFVDFNLYIPANGILAVWVGAMCREV